MEGREGNSVFVPHPKMDCSSPTTHLGRRCCCICAALPSVLEKQGGRKMLYHLSLEKIKFFKIWLVACEIPHVREDGWGLTLLFFFQYKILSAVQGSWGSSGTNQSVSRDLPKSNTARTACPCREGSLSFLLCIPSSRGTWTIPRREDPISLWKLVSHPEGECCMGRSRYPRILIYLLFCCWPTASTFYHPNPMPLAVWNFLLQEL